MVDESIAEAQEVRRAQRFSELGELLGNVLVCFLVAVAIIRFSNDIDSVRFDMFNIVLHSRIEAYLLAWFLMVTLTFNPFVAWGSWRPRMKSFGDSVGLGQWTVEKQRLQLICLELPVSSEIEDWSKKSWSGLGSWLSSDAHGSESQKLLSSARSEPAAGASPDTENTAFENIF